MYVKQIQFQDTRTSSLLAAAWLTTATAATLALKRGESVI